MKADNEVTDFAKLEDVVASCPATTSKPYYHETGPCRVHMDDLMGREVASGRVEVRTIEA